MNTTQLSPRSRFRRWTAALAACAAVCAAAQAQPVAIGAVAPPARVDTALRGSVLASMTAASPDACLAECKRVQGCTGYNFAAPGPGPVLPGSPGGKIGATVNPRAANCTLMSGALTDAANKGVVSCRMPCTAGNADATLPLPGAIVRGPGTGVVKPPLLNHPPPAAVPAAALPAVPVTPPLVAAGTYNPPPVAPAPAPAPIGVGMHPGTKTPVVRTGVSGYEVVPGPMVDVTPLSHAITSAQCPAGKVALSAGYRVTAGGDAQFGLEVRGAMPEGRLATVLVRNANVVDAAKAQAFAVCVNAIAGLRVVDGEINVQSSGGATSLQLTCAANERPIGGGLMGSNDLSIGSNAPQAAGASGIWQAGVTRSSPMPGSQNVPVRLLCAPEAAVDGWELIEAAEVSLGARSRAAPALSCPGTKVLLTVGVSQRSNNLLDMVVAMLAPQSNSLAWGAQIANRNTIGGSGAVRAALSAICARRQ